MALSKKDLKLLESFVQALDIDAKLISLAVEDIPVCDHDPEAHDKARAAITRLQERLGATKNYFDLKE